MADLITRAHDCFDGTRTMDVVRDDGGRAAAGYKGEAGDCACRAAAIATGRPYAEVYAAINTLAMRERITKRRRNRSSARNGVWGDTMHAYLKSLGWSWVPCMGIGTGCTVRLRAGELPGGPIIVRLSKHYTAVVDGVIRDTHDPQRQTLVDDGQRIAHRCVYGYWTRAAAE